MKLSERVHPEDRQRTCDKCGYTGRVDMGLRSSGKIRANCAKCRTDFGFVRLLSPPVPFSSEDSDGIRAMSCDPTKEQQFEDEIRTLRERDARRSTQIDPLLEREMNRQILRMEAEASGNPLSSALFVATFGGLPVFGASLIIEVTFAANWNNWILLGVSAGAMGVLGAVSHMDTDVSGTQAAMTAGWFVGFVMLIVAGVAALVRAVM